MHREYFSPVRHLSVIAIIGGICQGAAAQPQILEWRIEGTVIEMDDPDLIFADVRLGDPVRGFLRYDLAAPPDVIDPSYTIYEHDPTFAVVGMVVDNPRDDSELVLSTSDAGFAEVGIINNGEGELGLFDYVSAYQSVDAPDAFSGILPVVSVELVGPIESIASTDLPRALDLVDWPDAVIFFGDWLGVIGPPEEQSSYIFAEIHTLTPVMLPPLEGDFNGDAKVNAADYVIWRDGLGNTYSDGDYDVWRANFGRIAGGELAGTAAAASRLNVPEPSALSLSALAIPWCAWRTWRMRDTAKRPVKLPRNWRAHRVACTSRIAEMACKRQLVYLLRRADLPLIIADRLSDRLPRNVCSTTVHSGSYPMGVFDGCHGDRLRSNIGVVEIIIGPVTRRLQFAKDRCREAKFRLSRPAQISADKRVNVCVTHRHKTQVDEKHAGHMKGAIISPAHRRAVRRLIGRWRNCQLTRQSNKVVAIHQRGTTKSVRLSHTSGHICRTRLCHVSFRSMMSLISPVASTFTTTYRSSGCSGSTSFVNLQVPGNNSWVISYTLSAMSAKSNGAVIGVPFCPSFRSNSSTRLESIFSSWQTSSMLVAVDIGKPFLHRMVFCELFCTASILADECQRD
jgi:hypothetical protein